MKSRFSGIGRTGQSRIGWMALLIGVAAFGQPPTNGPAYWSTSVPSCSGVSGPVQINNSSGTLVGYSCYLSGTFGWLAAGDVWNSAIRISAPTIGAIGVDYTFYDDKGNDLSLDTSAGIGGAKSSGNQVVFALPPNKPSEINLLGATNTAPKYGSTAIGSVYVTVYCPNTNTCQAILPQLFFSALPTYSWTESVPILWDGSEWPQWSFVGIDNGSTQRVSFVIYNETANAATYSVRVYDSAGNLAGSGSTPSIPGFQTTASKFNEAGTYGALLSSVISSPLPQGAFKVLIDGGTVNAAVQAFQFTGPSATSLQVSYDYPPTASEVIVNSAVRRTSARSGARTSAPVFSPLQQ